MARRLLLLLPLFLAACQPDASGPGGDPSPAHEDAPPQDTVRTAPLTPFDAAETVFDTTEPPEVVVEIPPLPPPAPPPPRPDPAPPPPEGPVGSCDVRATEGYCFAYTGDAWTPEAARTQCDAAPEATFTAGTCPSADRTATCTFERDSAPGREIVYTYYAPYDPALAAIACPGRFERIE